MAIQRIPAQPGSEAGTQRVPSTTGASNAWRVPLLADPSMVKYDPGGIEVVLTQAANGEITVEIDRTILANLVDTALTLIWPLADFYNNAAEAGINWTTPPLVVEIVTPPAAASDMRISAGIAELGLTESTGMGAHYDVASFPEKFRETSTALTDSTQMSADLDKLIVCTTGSPFSSSVISIINTDGMYLDSSGDELLTYNQLALKDFDTAPYVYLSFGGSSAGAGTATAVVKFSYLPPSPLVGWGA